MDVEPPDPAPLTPEAAAPRPVRFRIPATARVAWVTPTILALNFLVFVAMVASGVSPLAPEAADLFRWGADFGPAVAGGEWWRVLSSAFVHVGLVHIALNMYVLWGAGVFAERVYGNVEYLVLYLLSAVGGSLLSTLWSPMAVSAGASGAIFGVFGAILAFSVGNRRELPNEVASRLRKGALTFVAYNVVFGLAIPNISNSAHMGGLATGFLAGWLLAPGSAPRPTSGWRRARILALLPILAGLAWGVTERVSRLPSQRAAREVAAANTAIEREDWKAAEDGLTRAVALDPEGAHALLLRGYVREQSSDRAGALADYGEAITRAPRWAEPLAFRCLARYRASDYAGAESDCRAGIALDPRSAESWHGLAEVLGVQGLAKDAVAAARTYLRLSPGSSHAHLVVAEGLIAQGELDAARSQIERAEKIEPQSAAAAATWAQLALREGDRAAALAAAERAVALEPEEAWPSWYGSIVQRAAGDVARAIADAERSVELDPEDATWHAALAWTLVSVGQPLPAAAAVEQALALVPEHPDALVTRCFLRVSLGDAGGGRADCERAVAQLPGNDAVTGMLAFLDGRPADAVLSWRQASVQSPEDAPYLEAWIARAGSPESGAVSAQRGSR